MAVITHKANVGGMASISRAHQRSARITASIALLEQDGSPEALAKIEKLKAEQEGHKANLRAVKEALDKMDLA